MGSVLYTRCPGVPKHAGDWRHPCSFQVWESSQFCNSARPFSLSRPLSLSRAHTHPHTHPHTLLPFIFSLPHFHSIRLLLLLPSSPSSSPPSPAHTDTHAPSSDRKAPPAEIQRRGCRERQRGPRKPPALDPRNIPTQYPIPPDARTGDARDRDWLGSCSCGSESKDPDACLFVLLLLDPVINPTGSWDDLGDDRAMY